MGQRARKKNWGHGCAYQASQAAIHLPKEVDWSRGVWAGLHRRNLEAECCQRSHDQQKQRWWRNQRQPWSHFVGGHNQAISYWPASHWVLYNDRWILTRKLGWSQPRESSWSNTSSEACKLDLQWQRVPRPEFLRHHSHEASQTWRTKDKVDEQPLLVRAPRNARPAKEQRRGYDSSLSCPLRSLLDQPCSSKPALHEASDSSR